MVFKVTEFAHFHICQRTLMAKKKRICMANAKMKKVRTYIASEIPLDKTHVLRIANFLSIFKLLFHFAQENKNFFTKICIISLFLGSFIWL